VVNQYASVDPATGTTVHDWARIWPIPAYGALAVLVLFALTFSAKDASASTAR